MKNVIKKYLESIEPINFNKNFNTDYDFFQWCLEGTKKDLECTLIEFTDSELYDRCAIIKSVIKLKTMYLN